MKNYYALIHFGGPYVSGYLLIGYPDPESARRGAIRELSAQIEYMQQKYPNDDYRYVKRLREFRRAFAKPWRNANDKGTIWKRPVLDMVELPQTAVISTGYWLAQIEREKEICNAPRTWEEHPMGYRCSQLKGPLSMSQRLGA